MAWFRYKLAAPLSEEQATALKALAGPRYLPWRREVVAPENAGWLTENALRYLGARFRVAARPAPAAQFSTFPAPPELRGWVPSFLVPYQRDFIMRYGQRDGALCLIPPGGGKTILCIVYGLLRPGPVLYVTRAGARRQVRREVERFTTARAFLVEGILKEPPPADARFVIAGWEALQQNLGHLLALSPTTFVADEIHLCRASKRREALLDAVSGAVKFRELKNRAMAAEKLSRKARYRIGATGTLVFDRLRNLWAQLDLVVPDAFGRGGYPFFYRYCAAHQNSYGGVDTRGCAAPPFIAELLQRMEPFTYYVPQAVSHRDLPAKRRQVVYVPQEELSSGREVVKELKEHPFRSGSDTWALLALAAAMKRQRVVEEALAAAVPNLEGGGGKVTVFTGLRSECERIAAKLRASEGLTVWMAHGGHSQAERERVQDEYMAHPGPCVLAATGDSFGQSLNLDKTDVAIIAMLPWTLGQVEQYEQRFQRLSTVRPVLILYLVAEGTYDERVAQALLEKLPAVVEVAKSETARDFGEDLKGNEDEIARGMVAKMMAMEAE